MLHSLAQMHRTHTHTHTHTRTHYLEVLEEGPPGDAAPVDLLQTQVSRRQQQRHQRLQVVPEIHLDVCNDRKGRGKSPRVAFLPIDAASSR